MSDTADRERWARVQRCFEAALEREGLARERYLETACAGDETLRDEVESLLAADERGHTLLEGIELRLTPDARE